MNRSGAARCLACFALFFAVFVSLLGSPIILAAEESSSSPILLPPSQGEALSEEPPLELTCRFPVVEGMSGHAFEFDVFITLAADEYAGKYDFNIITPPGWEAGVWGSYPEQQIGSIDFGEERVLDEEIEVRAVPLPGERPEPGEYVIALEMESAELEVKGGIDLTAMVNHSYEFSMFTGTGWPNAQVKAGEDNHISILLENTGTATIEDITFSSDKPEGWSITFNPEKVDTLEPDLKREVDVVIKPLKKAIGGDYLAVLKAKGERGSDTLDLRITVATPRVGEWSGIGIAVGVIAGLVVLFRQLVRR